MVIYEVVTSGTLKYTGNATWIFFENFIQVNILLDCLDCDYDYTGEEDLSSGLVVDTIEEIDEKFPKYQDPIGLKKPQWVKDLEKQEGSVDYSSIIVDLKIVSHFKSKI